MAGDKPWFDMENCAMCKNVDLEMMKAATHEQYPISNGIVSITTVPAKYIAKYREAHAAMVKTGERMAAGEMLEVCGSCTALGKCMMTNPHQEYVETMNGDVWILTSDEPEVVKDLQAWAERNKKEMKKMMEMEKKG
jgi:hypothetical protein